MNNRKYDEAGESSIPKIIALDTEVVNKIAAGEVIHNPCSAIKELLENSIDAGSTQINITLKGGGLEMLQIQDNGHGIRHEDLPILCNRHTTSKIREYEDLRKIKTLGFRGEALCSISYVSHLSVITMTRDEEHGYRAQYVDGEICNGGPRPHAAIPGTVICAEDLFYNLLTRRSCLRSTSEEYNAIIDIIRRYAIFAENIGFAVKKHGDLKVDLQVSQESSRLSKISTLYGSETLKHLVDVNLEIGNLENCNANNEDYSSSLVLKMSGLVSTLGYQSKKTTLILFVNGRCVECRALKKSLDALYAMLLPQPSKPFLFLDLQMPPQNIDVNVHPTKREVEFLYLEEIMHLICEVIKKKLEISNDKRTFPQRSIKARPISSEAAKESSEGMSIRSRLGGDHKMVRADYQLQTLGALIDKEFLQVPKRIKRDTNEQQQQQQLSEKSEKTDSIEMSSLQLEVKNIYKKEISDEHQGIRLILREHIFVGMLDDTLALVQHQTKLYQLNMKTLSYDMFYKILLKNFGRPETMAVDTEPNIRDLALVGLEIFEHDCCKREDDSEKKEIAKLIKCLLVKNRKCLSNWFGLVIDDGGKLLAIPRLMQGYVPDCDRMVELVVKLGNDVNSWSGEIECVIAIAKVIADFYSVNEPLIKSIAMGKERQDEEARRSWMIKNYLLKEMRSFRNLNKDLATNGSIIEITSLEELYKIFERC